LPAFGHRPLSRVRRENAKGLSASWVREAHLVVAAIFNAAVRDKMIAVSPCLSIALPEITVNRTAHRAAQGRPLIVSRDEWLAAREQLLVREKEFTPAERRAKH
jgi:hypothetical protein